ncbi:MAG: hypothetical protein U9O89_00520 [Thermoproteota archaeon]|nr:hypothetical protein [Thermoproteota archaeon]
MAEDEIRLQYTGFILFLSRLLSVGTGLLFSLMVTRSVTRVKFGIYGNISDVLSYFTLPALMIPFWTTRFTARNHAGSPRTGLVANLLLSTVFASIYMLLLPTIITLLGMEAHIILYAIVAVRILEIYTLRAFEAILHAKRPQKIGFGFLIFEVCKVIIGFVLIIHLHLGLLGALSSVILAYIAQLAYYLILTANQLREKMRLDLLKEWIKASPVNLYDVAGQRIPAFVLIILFVCAGEQARGFYGAAATIASIVAYSQFLAFALYPKLLSKTNPEDVSTSLRMVLMFAIPMAAGAIILSDSYLTILKSWWRPARPVLMVLAVNALCLSLSMVFNTVALGVEKLDAKAKIPFKQVVKSRLFQIFTLRYVQAAVTIPVTYFTLTSINKTGMDVEAATYVAVINLTTNIALLLARYTLAKKCLNFSVPWRNTAKYTVATAVMGVALIVLPHPTRLSYTVAVTLLGGIIYLLTLLPIDGQARSLVHSVLQETRKLTKLSKQ